MIEQTGRVSRVEGGRAWIACRPAACRACDEGRGCGAGVFAGLLSRAPSRVVLPRTNGLNPGDRVIIGLDERRLLTASVRLYGCPLAGLLVGALLGALAGGAANDIAVLSGALAGLGLALWFVRRVPGFAPEPVFLGHCTEDEQ
jgi:sigma-E factor negative regulatory protein RseC